MSEHLHAQALIERRTNPFSGRDHGGPAPAPAPGGGGASVQGSASVGSELEPPTSPERVTRAVVTLDAELRPMSGHEEELVESFADRRNTAALCI